LNAVANTEIKSNFDIDIESGRSFLLEAGFDAVVKANRDIGIDSGAEVDINAGTSVTVDGAVSLNLDDGIIGLNGTCSGVAGQLDQVIVAPVTGIGSILSDSSQVFVC
jgi:hypothetical protein